MSLQECCNICLESFTDLQKRHRVLITLQCSHKYCKVCLKKYAQVEINDWRLPKCPDPTCQVFITVKGIIPKKQILVMEKTKLEIQQGKRHCTQNTCNGYVELFDCVLRCSKCLIQICSLCEKIDNSTHRCNKDDKKSIQSIRNSPKCPKCRIPFVKESGCKNMQCTICNYKFRMTDLQINNLTLGQCSKCTMHCNHHYFKEYCCTCISLLFDNEINGICKLCLIRLKVVATN